MDSPFEFTLNKLVQVHMKKNMHPSVSYRYPLRESPNTLTLYPNVTSYNCNKVYSGFDLI